ncbi:MAG: bacillithiol biosynthesis cysteine-adding enzyme BshC [Ferruginibacter sp.]
MKFKSHYIPYHKTGAFSKIVEDYLNGENSLKEFYEHDPDLAGIKKAIKERKKYNYNRSLLVNELNKQYSNADTNEKVKANIDTLLNENTFTICTAHQPNIFTGHLYFIYKILHAIKLADKLNSKIKDAHFVPVYYMGSEDADLAELGEVSINGKKYEWKTKQKGAVGRMKIDKIFIDLVNEIEGQLSVEKYGNEILALVKRSYTLGKTIEQATFEFVNTLFEDKGLIVFLPDNAALKNESYSINERELTEQFSEKIVAETIASFPKKYKVQAAGREINLFYLKDDTRERIEKYKEGFIVANTETRFTKEEILSELKQHPERFSPNVILRPVFQEMILPNIAFIGGGGELAYWLELKKVFHAVKVPFPVLMLRNSFMIVNKKLAAGISKLQFKTTDLFKPSAALIEELVKRESKLILSLAEERKAVQSLYKKMQSAATAVDVTLNKHVDALAIQALKRIDSLEKKMLKAEKKKFEAAQRQIIKIKEALFPGGTLQERVDNLLPFYAVWGKEFIELLYENSTADEQEFCILEEK